MKAWKCLVTLQWLTGEDGKVSFSKLVLVVVLGLEGLITLYLMKAEDLTASLWPLLWMFALTIAGSHGIKGLQLWFQAAKLRTNANSDLSRIEQNRDHELGIEPTP